MRNIDKIQKEFKNFSKYIGHSFIRGNAFFDDSRVKYFVGNFYFIEGIDEKRDPTRIEYQDVDSTGNVVINFLITPFFIARRFSVDKKGAKHKKVKEDTNSYNLYTFFHDLLVSGNLKYLGDLGDLSQTESIDNIQEVLRPFI